MTSETLAVIIGSVGTIVLGTAGFAGNFVFRLFRELRVQLEDARNAYSHLEERHNALAIKCADDTQRLTDQIAMLKRDIYMRRSSDYRP